ncbi:MAG TPA: translation initiation factor IF-2 [Polyangia bacterium]|jgi:translation initiation factor IF-2|nr:translation initiation factor IF-2 [Polyangia bacterium]
MIGSGYERRSEGSSSAPEAPQGPKVRVYEVAKELGIANRDLVTKIRAMGIEVANHMSHLEPGELDRIRRSLDRERQESLVEERLNDTVIRRRSKGAPPAAARPAPAPTQAAATPVTTAPPSAPSPAPAAPPVRARTVVEVNPSTAPAKPAPPVDEKREPTIAAPPVTPARVVVEMTPSAPATKTEPRPPLETLAAAKGPSTTVVEVRPPAAPLAAAAAGTAAPGTVIRQIPSPVVTGSAATGAFIQLPGLAPRGEPGVPKIEIKDRDEELRRLGRTGLINRTPAGAGRDRYGRAAFGTPGQRPGAPPKKRVAAAGKKIKQTQITTPAEHKRVVRMADTIAVSDLAQKMGIKGKEVIKKLWALGMMGVNINQDIDLDTATLIATEFGYQIESTAFNEEEVLTETEVADNPEDLVPRAPVVTIMGHVDHGKTSLLDAIRKANVAGGEAGGITQHIGAYKVHSDRGDVVFLDTPGHEAFTAMRARGAQMTDIVVLVVAADDGPMPQTIEAINHAKEADVPILVAVNKIDKPGANPEQIRNKLSEHGLVSEEWGGSTIYVNVSAKTKQGIDKLLEMLALQAEVLELKANPNRAAKGHVVEARLDRSRGPISTILVEEGTMRLGDLIVAGEFSGKIRAMLGDKGQAVTEAGPSTPVEVLGIDGVPDAGEIFNAVSDEKAAKSLVEHRRDARRKKDIAGSARVSLENILDKIKAGEVKEVKIVLKADVQGSVEAVSNALTNLSTESVGVNVISTGVGGITESDVSLAKASSAVIIGFNVRPAGKSQQLAEQEGVDIKLYQIIYEALDDVKKAMVGMLAPVLRERVLGKAEVRQVFTIPKAGTIAGSFVIDGKILRKAQVRVIRDSVVVFTGKIGSLRRFKDDASEVAQGYECGISVEGYGDVKEGDVIEAFEIESVAPTLDAPIGQGAKR